MSPTAIFAALDLSSASAESDDAICSKCGMSYADGGGGGGGGGLWVCWDGCDQPLNVPTSGKQ